MRQNKRMIIALILLISLATGCGKEAVLSDNNETTSVESDGTETSATTEPSIDPGVEAVDLGGREYTILNRQHGDYAFPYAEFQAEEENGDLVNDGVYKRNLAIEDKYKVKLVSVETDDVVGNAKNAVLAGDKTYDLLMPMISDAFSLAVQGCLLNMSDLPHIDLSKPYWMDSIVEASSIGGRNYFLSGDMNASVLNAVGATFFNKDLAALYQINDVYDVVKAGKFTLDKLTEYCRLVYNDLNGNAEYDSEDRYGLDCSTFAWQPLYYGAGMSMISKDKDDIPSLAWDTEKNIDAIAKIVKLLNDKTTTILVNQYSELHAIGLGNATFNIFREDRALFFSEVMYGAMQFRDMKSDFGILPLPKYDEKQEKYASYVHTNQSSAVCVPITNEDIELAGMLLEDMAYQSYLNVRPAFYDVTLKIKFTRDEDTAEIIDMIYENINIDLTLVMNRSGLPIDNTLRTAMLENRTDLASMIASQKSSCEETINSNVKTILALEK